jgi:hypothetical protein
MLQVERLFIDPLLAEKVFSVGVWYDQNPGATSQPGKALRVLPASNIGNLRGRK